MFGSCFRTLAVVVVSDFCGGESVASGLVLQFPTSWKLGPRQSGLSQHQRGLKEIFLVRVGTKGLTSSFAVQFSTKE